jgi:hypothetical protein
MKFTKSHSHLSLEDSVLTNDSKEYLKADDSKIKNERLKDKFKMFAEKLGLKLRL